MASFDNMLKAIKPIKLYSLLWYTVVYKELDIYGRTLDSLSDLVDEIIKEAFIQTAEDVGLSIHEKLSGAERFDLTTEERRNLLLASRQISCNDNTLDGVYKYLNSLGLQCEIKEFPNIFYLYILSQGREYSRAEQDYIKGMAARFLPCHMTFTIDFRKETWQDFNNLNLSFSQLDALELMWADWESGDIKNKILNRRSR